MGLKKTNQWTGQWSWRWTIRISIPKLSQKHNLVLHCGGRMLKTEQGTIKTSKTSKRKSKRRYWCSFKATDHDHQVASQRKIKQAKKWCITLYNFASFSYQNYLIIRRKSQALPPSKFQVLSRNWPDNSWRQA